MKSNTKLKHILPSKSLGFTLVEFMVCVAIFGVLALVAFPNFQKYRAKARTAEAKIQLAATYTALNTFKMTYGIYHTCLDYMGYNPADEISNRFYSIGFNIIAAISSNAQLTSVTSGLNNTLCPENLAPASNVTYFSAGKKVGIIPLIPAPLSVDTSIGDQSNVANMTFTVGAVGVISFKATSSSTSSRWTINNNKVLTIQSVGY